MLQLVLSNAIITTRSDLCKVPILDYHRHCTKCSYDLCLTCCRDIRRASSVAINLPVDGWSSDRSKDVTAETTCPESSGKTETDECSIDFSHQFPKWKANRDGTIPCCPVETGGCGSSELVLRRLFKINWVAKLVKSAEEMVSGCITRDPDTLPGCLCQNNIVSQSNGLNAFTCHQCSNRESSIDNFLYFPVAQDIKLNGISHFHQHWSRGEPVIVRHTFECPLASSWDPTIIWRGIQEMIDKKTDDSIKVKAFSCNDLSEVCYFLVTTFFYLM